MAVMVFSNADQSGAVFMFRLGSSFAFRWVWLFHSRYDFFGPWVAGRRLPRRELPQQWFRSSFFLFVITLSSLIIRSGVDAPRNNTYYTMDGNLSRKSSRYIDVFCVFTVFFADIHELLRVRAGFGTHTSMRALGVKFLPPVDAPRGVANVLQTSTRKNCSAVLFRDNITKVSSARLFGNKQRIFHLRQIFTSLRFQKPTRRRPPAANSITSG
jgi:hypothetical protein